MRENESYEIAYNIDRGDGSKLSELLDERDELRHTLIGVNEALRLVGGYERTVNHIDSVLKKYETKQNERANENEAR
jgi:hypothetical protein